MSTQKPTKYKRKLGDAIKKARKEIGLSQKQFADQLEISDKTISSYEVGRAEPSLSTLKKMSEVVNKPISYFDTDSEMGDIDLQIKLRIIERELLEIKKLLKKRKE